MADGALELTAVQTTTLECTHTDRIPYPLPSTCPARGMTWHSSGLHGYKAETWCSGDRFQRVLHWNSQNKWNAEDGEVEGCTVGKRPWVAEMKGL